MPTAYQLLPSIVVQFRETLRVRIVRLSGPEKHLSSPSWLPFLGILAHERAYLSLPAKDAPWRLLLGPEYKREVCLCDVAGSERPSRVAHREHVPDKPACTMLVQSSSRSHRVLCDLPYLDDGVNGSAAMFVPHIERATSPSGANVTVLWRTSHQ